MSMHKTNTFDEPQGNQLPAADTGNASNPTPHAHQTPSNDQQLLNKKAETYLRESGNIEDMPDPQEEENAAETMEQKGKSALGNDQ